MRERTTKEHSFPYWVAMGSLLFVLLLFFTNTVPALEERQNLTATHRELIDLRQQYEDAIDSAAQLAGLGTGPDSCDLQSLLVAIDQQGYTPLELDVIYRQMAQMRAGDDALEPNSNPR